MGRGETQRLRCFAGVIQGGALAAFWVLFEEAKGSAFKFRWSCGENQGPERMSKGRDLGKSVVHRCLKKGRRSVLGVKEEGKALGHSEDPISGHCVDVLHQAFT